jgi:hypothetical protein
MLQQIMNNKKGVSIMVGYVLLVTLAIVMGGIIYVWMKSYVPVDKVGCPDGTSFVVTGYDYECSNLTRINVTIKNNGLFGIAGFFIKGDTNESKRIPAIDMSQYLLRTNEVYRYPAKQAVLIGEGNTNNLEPNEVITTTYNLTSFADPLEVIEIMPFRWDREDNKLYFTSCGDVSIIREKISCQ